ncbi:hypothetical protein Bxe_A2678 [Paraburkholderia xenovorans LB400]|uniref:Uncharacterized protein n=1 Tax=Paraburkholderia xenovorans (strain LB400) TaxID=266265 RepID=Q140F6_PARXL|nr:hypothetical protein Bxe_A2678 [Paraburkholderia xenovorans LB400]
MSTGLSDYSPRPRWRGHPRWAGTRPALIAGPLTARMMSRRSLIARRVDSAATWMAQMPGAAQSHGHPAVSCLTTGSGSKFGAATRTRPLASGCAFFVGDEGIHGRVPVQGLLPWSIDFVCLNAGAKPHATSKAHMRFARMRVSAEPVLCFLRESTDTHGHTCIRAVSTPGSLSKRTACAPTIQCQRRSDIVAN